MSKPKQIQPLDYGALDPPSKPNRSKLDFQTKSVEPAPHHQTKTTIAHQTQTTVKPRPKEAHKPPSNPDHR